MNTPENPIFGEPTKEILKEIEEKEETINESLWNEILEQIPRLAD